MRPERTKARYSDVKDAVPALFFRAILWASRSDQAPGMVLDDPTAREVRPDNGRVVWSAEGRYLFHAEGGGVTRLEVSTGTTTRVASGKTGGFAVSPDGEILYLTLMSPHVRRHVITNFGDRPRP